MVLTVLGKDGIKLCGIGKINLAASLRFAVFVHFGRGPIGIKFPHFAALFAFKGDCPIFSIHLNIGGAVKR